MAGDWRPSNPDEFPIWMVEKIGQIHTQQAEISGKIDVAIAQHAALKERVDVVEAEARTAKHWENGKILLSTLASFSAAFFRHH